MEDAKTWMISILMAALVCGLVLGIQKKGKGSKILNLLCGAVLLLSILGPLKGLPYYRFDRWKYEFENEAEDIVREGKDYAQSQLMDIIKKECEAYILDKASSMDAKIEVEISIRNSSPPIPEEITVKGTVPPYTKQLLKNIIIQDLGITEDCQIWTS